MLALFVISCVTLKTDKIHYQPNHLWNGKKAVKKKKLIWEKPKAVKQWLSRQTFWQVHLPAPKRVDRPHYEVTTPNGMHQFDLLYMPSDSLYGSKYKYILAGIDAASRYKVMSPLRTKQARMLNEDEEVIRNTYYDSIYHIHKGMRICRNAPIYAATHGNDIIIRGDGASLRFGGIVPVEIASRREKRIRY